MSKEKLIIVRSDEIFKTKVTQYAESLGLTVSALIRMLLIEKMKEDEK